MYLRYTLLSWTSLLPTTVFQERSFGDTCKKSRHRSIWEISFRPCTQDAYTFSLMATEFLRRLSPTEAWNSAALWVPFCHIHGTPLITMTWTDSWLYREVLPLPWIQFNPSLWLCWWHCSHFKHGCNSNWTNSMTIHVLKGSSSTLTKQKSWSSSAGATLRFPPSRTTAHLWNLSLNSNTLKSLLLVMEACSQLLRRWQTNSGPPLPEFTESVTARVSSTKNMQCYGFSRSLLWQLVCTVVKYGPLLHSLTYNSSKITPTHVLHLGFLKRHLGVKKGTDIYSLRAFAKQVRCPFFLLV